MFDFQRDCGLKVIKGLVSGENLSRIYGFILYTEQNPYVVKVLQDNAFWNALDSISGCNWPIFAVRPLQPGQNVIKGGRYGLGMLVSVWDEPTENIPVLLDFGLKDSEELPLFVVFMWDDQDELNEVAIPIRGTDVDSTYRSLEEIVKVISVTEKNILPQYKQTVSVFRNVKAALEALDFKYKAVQRGKILKKIADLLSVFC